jgi:hypothetical protein
MWLVISELMTAGPIELIRSCIFRVACGRRPERELVYGKSRVELLTAYDTAMAISARYLLLFLDQTTVMTMGQSNTPFTPPLPFVCLENAGNYQRTKLFVLNKLSEWIIFAIRIQL